MEQHSFTFEVKQSSKWTNDAGETFPAAPLHRAGCSCGWRSGVYMASLDRARAIHEHHAASAAGAPALYDLPVFAWAWKGDARDVERH